MTTLPQFKKFALICIILASIIITSCQEQTEELKIGAILPLSGNLAQVGESGQIGLMLAEKYINERESKKVKFYYEDGKGNPTASINAATKLTSFDGVEVIFSIISAVDLSIIPLQEKDSFLMFSHASHPKLSNINDLFFRHSQTIQQETDLILSKIDTLSTISICYMMDDYGIAFAQELEQRAQNNPIKSIISFMPNETNFSTIAKKIIDSNADVIVICAGGKNISDLIRKIREQNYQGEIITTLAYIVSGADKLTRDISNLSMINFKQVQLEESFQKFIQDSEKASGKTIGTSEIMFFNSALLVYENALHSNSPQTIASEIKEDSIYTILGSRITVTSTNDILPELEIIKQ